MPRKIENLDEFNSALKEAGDKLVVVDFTATWCRPCQRISPEFEKLTEAPENKDVVFLMVDVDDASDVSGHLEIQFMPTFKFYKNGEEVFQFSGADIDQLKEKVAELK